MKINLMEHQLDVVDRLGSGKILYGGVGAGKSATILEYYMRNEAPADIFVITTAKKRDSLDWQKEAGWFGISTDPTLSVAGRLVVDSWNNIDRYLNVEGAFFILDEQRLIGGGMWVSSFYEIARKNRWVLLTGTPADVWKDYAPVFIANGYYRNITDFRTQHIVYAPRVRYPKVSYYINTDKLEYLRNEVLVEMPYWGENKRYPNWLDVGHDKEMFELVWKKRWNPYESQPIRDAAELFRLARRVVNEDPSRIDMLRQLFNMCHDKIVIFYNFNYELEILRTLADEIEVGEWNGHKKEPIPKTDKWLYLVQYQSGAEGWNCTETNAMVFYSMTSSWKNFEQAQGRIDRMNSPFKQLYYYIFVSNTPIDKAIKRSLETKKNFNERRFMAKHLVKSDVKSDTFGKVDELEVKYGLGLT